MDCTEFQAIVAGEREEDLSKAESSGFESHLEMCASCREAVARAEEDLERLGQLADPPLVAATAWSPVDEAIRAQAQRKPGREDPFGPIVALATVAAAVEVVPVAPAMPVTLGGRGAVAAPRSKPFLAFAACAAAAVIAVVFALGRPSGPPIGKVKPPENGDVVELEDTKLGPGWKKIKGTKFVHLQGE